MKSLFIISLFSLFFGIPNTSAQEVKELWENDSMKLSGHLVGGERDGFWQEWYPNGHLKYKGTYKNGDLDGIWMYFCKHGFPEREVIWKRGMCYSIITYFSQGQPYVFMDFEDGITQQEYFKYLEIFKWGRSNQKRLLSENKEDEEHIHGRYIIYKVPRQHMFMFGINEGLKDSYLDSLDIFERMRNDYLVLFCKSLDQKFEFVKYVSAGKEEIIKDFGDGNYWKYIHDYYTIEPYAMYQEEVYFNDKLFYEAEHFINGEEFHSCIEYDSNGQKQSEGKYKRGKQYGSWKYYGLNERLIKKEVYKNGTSVKMKEYSN